MNKRAYLFGIYFCVCLVFLTLTFLGNMAITVLSQSMPVERKHCVIIDAGHGFPDGGTTSVSGVLECNLNLQIAKKVESIMNLLGVQTVMTRTTEESVYTIGNTIAQKKVSDIRNRVSLVNTTPNSILISIHQNYFTDSQYRGAQLFYADTEESETLASDMQNAFVKALQPSNNRQPKESKGVYLMEHINCTGVLVECGFLSNPEEDALLKNTNYQNQVAGILAVCASNYLDRLEQN